MTPAHSLAACSPWVYWGDGNRAGRHHTGSCANVSGTSDSHQIILVMNSEGVGVLGFFPVVFNTNNTIIFNFILGRESR